MALSNAAKSGVAIFVGAAQLSILLIVSEAIYSAYGTNSYGYVHGYAYSVSTNFVSDMGATCPLSGYTFITTNCYIPPSALLFDSTMVVFGLLLLLGAYFFHRAFKWMPATLLLALTGVCFSGVGLLPETTGNWHSLASNSSFIFLALFAIVTHRFQKKPMWYFSVILVAMTVIVFILYASNLYLGLGIGGMERVLTNPLAVWMIGFSWNLMALEDKART